jgi:hypothetical protein
MEKRFYMDCTLTPEGEDIFANMREYLYWTGPRFQFAEHFTLNASREFMKEAAGKRKAREIAVAMRREGSGNKWGCSCNMW